MHNTNQSPARRVVREFLLVAALAAALFSPALAFAQGPLDNLQQLVDAVKATPGCLGVEIARTVSGKQVLFAWFEDKRAVLAWVNSMAHQQAMRAAPPSAFTGRVPLADVPDDGRPVMTVASFVFAPAGAGAGLRVSQISIELYAPLPGGFAAGGRFAPESLAVPGLVSVPLAPQKE